MKFCSAEWKEKDIERCPLLSSRDQTSNENIPEGRADEATQQPGITLSDNKLIK